MTTEIGVGTRREAVAIQSDGKIVAAGYSNTGSAYDFALARYNENGTLDTSFDTDGKVITEIGSVYDMRGGRAPVGRQDRGRGYSFNGSDYDFALARYNQDGSLDTSFDGDGKVITEIRLGPRLRAAGRDPVGRQDRGRGIQR